MNRKHMKLPNGFGQISKLKKPLRNPYRAMVTVGTAENGRPICKLLKPKAYFKTYNEAYMALMDYHRNPYDLESAGTTLEELYDKWFERHSKNLTLRSAQNINSAWVHFSGLKNAKIRELKPGNIKLYIESCDVSDNLKPKMKNIISMMYDYAIEFDMVDRNPAKQFKLSLKPLEHKHHISFTEDELNVIWENINLPGVDMMLIQCYMGWRPRELININIEDISENVIKGGLKTNAGRNRVVPIHPCIEGLIRARIGVKREGRLFQVTSYSSYYDLFTANIKKMGLSEEHSPHDCRKTFVTLCKKYKVDEYAIKRMVGHAIKDLTEETYTDRSIKWLIEEVKKIQK
ncbi:MAG: integrase [Pseudobutyrivibrio sp.]|nr:integrase [Pseudobutyrivibrio sp.]